MSDGFLFTLAGLLALITLYGSMNGGDVTMAALFLVLTMVTLLQVRMEPSHHRYLLVTGIPLTLTVGPNAALIIPLATLVLALTLHAGGVLSSRREYLMFAGAVGFSLPILLTFPFTTDAAVLALLYLSAGGIFVAFIALARLRLVVRVRSDTG